MRRSSSPSLIALLLTSWCSIASAQTPEGNTARVHVVADSPDATLYQHQRPRSPKPICRPPCDRVLDAGEGTTYFIAGDGVARSRPFTLAGRSGDVTLDVKAEPTSSLVHGIVMIAFGGAALVGGGTLLMFASMHDQPGPIFGRMQDRSDRSGETGMFVGGGVAMGTGVAMIAGGIVALVFSKTRVNISRIEPSPAGLSFRF